MSAPAIGTTIRNAGQTFRVVERHNLSHLGSRWFGKYRFVLVDANGARWTASGKTVTANSVLSTAR